MRKNSSMHRKDEKTWEQNHDHIQQQKRSSCSIRLGSLCYLVYVKHLDDLLVPAHPSIQ